MNVRLLVDGIVRQTTILIAQLSTTAGVRAPLAHVADQVFLDLAREIEGQGVGRKVAADMFGLALRSYQKKVQRLTASTTDKSRTLWQAVLDFLRDGSKSRARIVERFAYDGEREVKAVLNDLVSSGLVYCTGKPEVAIYGLTSEADLHAVTADRDLASVANVVWLHTFLGQARTEAALTERLGLEPALVAAVLDHYRAVSTAIAAKAGAGKQSSEGDEVGGATLTFSLHRGHPQEAAVRALLATVRSQTNALWKAVTEHAEERPPSEDDLTVTFYFGQMVTRADDDYALSGSPTGMF